MTRKAGLLLVTAPRSRPPKLGRGVAWVNRPRPHVPALTPRQTDVLRELASGLRTKEIALKLKVSIKTVETHRLQLMQRLGIRLIPRLVRFALQTGVLPASWLLEEDA